MSEVNHNTPAFDVQSSLSEANKTSDAWSNNQGVEPEQLTEIVSESTASNDDSPIAQEPGLGEDQEKSQNKLVSSESLVHKMNWQRVAIKLREYNRKLLKKVFRLEQELAEIDNKFNKYVEKSQNSDLLLAQQAEEIKQFQEKVTLLNQQLSTSQQQAEHQELLVQQISKKQQLAEKQTAQLERECTLLQERYNHQVFELATKEQASQELQNQLAQQQQTIERQKAELTKYQSGATLRQDKVNKNNQQKNYPHNRFIQPWSTSAIPDPKIALPRNKALPTKVKRTNSNILDPLKTTAEVTTWSNPATANNPGKKPQPVKSNGQSNSSKKPQSLAAVDLPTFPRSR